MAPVHTHAHDRGFTLVEIIITLLVTLIAASLVVPMFADAGTQRLSEAARMLAADAQFAQSESIAHGDDPRLLVFDKAKNTYFIAAKSDPGTPITDPANGQPYKITFGQGPARQLAGVHIQSFSLAGDNKLGFGIYGQLDQTTPATVSLTDGSGELTVSFDPSTGMASIGAVK